MRAGSAKRAIWGTGDEAAPGVGEGSGAAHGADRGIWVVHGTDRGASGGI
jgi:hypothetical protein